MGYVLSILMNALRTWLLTKLWDSFFTRRFNGKQFWAYWLLWTAIITVVLNVLPNDYDYSNIIRFLIEIAHEYARYNGLFYEFDIMKYIPKLLNNIALDSGNKITQSIPLGHLGNFDSMFTPQRFVEQIVAFEYLFDKLEHKKAQNLQFPLKKELEYMFNEYPQLLSQTNLSAEKVSNQIKEIRRTIAHGYAYYYDFKNDRSSKYLMILLDKLIRCMSLKLIGFSNDDISNFMPFYP